MLNINQIGSFSNISFTVSGVWDSDGYAAFSISSNSDLPAGSEFDLMMVPTGTVLDQASFNSIIYSRTSNASGFILLQNQYYVDGPFITVAPDHATMKNIDSPFCFGNNYFNIAYQLRLKNLATQEVLATYFNYNTVDAYLAPPSIIHANNISLLSEFDGVSSGNILQLKLRMDLKDKDGSSINIPNYLTSTPDPYFITIKDSANRFYSASGTLLAPSSPSWLNSTYFPVFSGIHITLPIASGSMIGVTDVQKQFTDYMISVNTVGINGSYRVDLSGVPNGFTFNTKPIREQYNKISITTDVIDLQNTGMEVKVTNNGNLNKYRFSVGVADISCQNLKYEKFGTYISDTVLLDSPIYTFRLIVDEILGNSDSYESIKYYVSFDNNEWIRVSPTNRGNEIVNNVIIPKMLILDTLDLGAVLTGIQEVLLPNPVYSYRLRIDLDMLDATSDNFISPEVLSYECRIADTASLLRT
jgi:hypothetical protein